MKLTRLLALAAFALPVLAHAHPGHEGHELTWDFTSGATHPLAGWDHLLAMVAVGLWAARLGGRSRWLVPAVFASCLVVGAALAHAGFAPLGLEQGIAASIFVLGLLVVAAVRPAAAASAMLIGGFALFHGAAHGAEMPATANGLGYGAGFVGTTLCLHLAGLGLGAALEGREKAFRLAGGAVALAGAAALAF